jgi:hypothetical protein
MVISPTISCQMLPDATLPNGLDTDLRFSAIADCNRCGGSDGYRNQRQAVGRDHPPQRPSGPLAAGHARPVLITGITSRAPNACDSRGQRHLVIGRQFVLSLPRQHPSLGSALDEVVSEARESGLQPARSGQVLARVCAELGSDFSGVMGAFRLARNQVAGQVINIGQCIVTTRNSQVVDRPNCPTRRRNSGLIQRLFTHNL